MFITSLKKSRKRLVNQMKEMMDLVKYTQANQIKDESQLKHLQESVYFINDKFGEYEKDKKEKTSCLLENILIDVISKIVCLEQKIDKQEQYSRQNCVLVHGLTEK